MFNRFLLQACGLAGLLLLLAGCQTPPQTQQLLAAPPKIAKQHLITNVPFYPQQQYFCGPTTLSEVAAFYGNNISPESIAPNTFIPDLAGTLQIEMTAATRQLGLLAYAQRGNMQQLLSLVAEDIPIIVLQNNSIAWLPQWHYAVVIGYDLGSGEVILHSGVTKAHRLNFATFERTWQRGNYWLLAMLPPDKTSAQLEPFIYTKASQDLLNTQQIDSGLAALKTATEQWPDYWLPYFLLGNYYYSSQPQTAAHWFAKGQPYAQQELPFLNNHAMLQSQLDCHDKASALIQTALRLAPNDNKLLDSQLQIQAALTKASLTQSQCALDTVDLR
jgi:tetratricopeptide (TPR) repeat protein